MSIRCPVHFSVFSLSKEKSSTRNCLETRSHSFTSVEAMRIALPVWRQDSTLKWWGVEDSRTQGEEITHHPDFESPRNPTRIGAIVFQVLRYISCFEWKHSSIMGRCSDINRRGNGEFLSCRVIVPGCRACSRGLLMAKIYILNW